ncbi:MAG: pyridoxal-phosphate dependent enzyme [Candidatus Latescibacterota bacterium]
MQSSRLDFNAFYRYVNITPLVRFAGPTGFWNSMYLKEENFQKTGAFKVRGNVAKFLLQEKPFRAVVTASSGNHGAGMSHAASVFGARAVVVVPEKTSPQKVNRIRNSGAELIFHGAVYDEAKKYAQDMAASENLTYIPSFDDPEVIEGNKTIAREICNQLTVLPDTIFLPIGGGGLVSAHLEMFEDKPVRIIGVEEDTAPAMHDSLSAGKRIYLDHAEGIAEGMLVRSPGEITFEIAKSHNLEVRKVSAADIRRSMKLILDHCGFRAETAGASSLAAALNDPSGGETCVCIISGGNITPEDFERHMELLEK